MNNVWIVAGGICLLWTGACIIISILESRGFWKRVKIDKSEKKS